MHSTGLWRGAAPATAPRGIALDATIDQVVVSGESQVSMSISKRPRDAYVLSR
jgi:hypothetical protein